MYTIKRYPSPFEDDETVEVHINGELRGIKYGNQWLLIRDPVYPVELSRAQGYRYWKRHFPDKPCWLLPQILQDAIDKEAEYKCTKGDVGYYG